MEKVFFVILFYLQIFTVLFSQLLEFATDKLGLPFAGRRVFLEDGVEVFHEKDIPPDGDIYISMGEKFKDPFRSTKSKQGFLQKILCTLCHIGLVTQLLLDNRNPNVKVEFAVLCYLHSIERKNV